jgi:hypothetical protein
MPEQLLGPNTVSSKTTSSREGYEQNKTTSTSLLLLTCLHHHQSYDPYQPWSISINLFFNLLHSSLHHCTTPNLRASILTMEDVHETSSFTRLYDDEKLPPRQITWSRRHPYRILGAVAGTIALLGITLGVGLGVGLTNSENAPSTTSTVVLDKRSKTSLATASQASSCKAGVLSVLGGLNVYSNTTPLWQPLPGTPWQIVLSSPVNAWKPMVPALSIYDIDMYGNNALTIQQMHLQGIKVICYFSAGSWEIFAPDAGLFAAQDLGNDLRGWPGQRWLNTDSQSVRDIMATRIRLAAERGCDAVDSDNMDGFVSSPLH